MIVTFILKDLSEQFYQGFGQHIKGLLNMTDEEKFHYLQQKGQELGVTMKVGDNSFARKVELNSLLKGKPSFTFKLEPRRGYKLATFIVI